MDLSAVTSALDAARAADPEGYRMRGTAPRAAVRPSDEFEVAEVMRAASREGLGVVPWGGGVSLSREAAPPRFDVALDLRGLSRVTHFERDDFTLTAQAGVSIADLRARVEAEGLELPLEAAEAWGATLGGVLAANASGPRRRRFGSPRDRILGARFVTGDGTEARTGGQVVKNVAGLAVHRLLCGSKGGLSVITEASLKLRPLSLGRLAMVHGLSAAELADASRWHGLLRREPSAVTLLGRALAATHPVLASEQEFTVITLFEDDPSWIPSQEAFLRERLGAPRLKVADASVATLLQQITDPEEMPGPRLTFTTSSGTPDALGPALAILPSGRIAFHAPAGRLHVWPEAAEAASLPAKLAPHGFTLIEAHGLETPIAMEAAPGVRSLRARLRTALDPASTLPLGDLWEKRA